MQYVIDRIEGGFAVAELADGGRADVPLAALPAGCREGDVVSVTVDAEATKRRRREIRRLEDDVWGG
jgi:hypothetical protein